MKRLLFPNRRKMDEASIKNKLWVDGSTFKNGSVHAKGGIGLYGRVNEQDVKISLPVVRRKVTNIVCEMLAIQEAINILSKYEEPGIIYTDSMFCINSLTKWCVKWKENEWKKSDGKSVENTDLMIPLYESYIKTSHFIHFKHVKAHRGVFGNEMADMLAKKASSV
jgi:ribonuclease HI